MEEPQHDTAFASRRHRRHRRLLLILLSPLMLSMPPATRQPTRDFPLFIITQHVI